MTPHFFATNLSVLCMVLSPWLLDYEGIIAWTRKEIKGVKENCCGIFDGGKDVKNSKK